VGQYIFVQVCTGFHDQLSTSKRFISIGCWPEIFTNFYHKFLIVQLRLHKNLKNTDEYAQKDSAEPINFDTASPTEQSSFSSDDAAVCLLSYDAGICEDFSE
jgi:hypothetical protein